MPRADAGLARALRGGHGMEQTVEVTTGESVAFSYELAGLGSRFLAVFIDLTIQLGVGGALVFAVFAVASTLAGAHALSKVGGSVAAALAIVAAFLLFFGYFIAFETLSNGRTPGKRLVGIRVVREEGFPVDFSSALIRNVVRILEASLGFYVLSAACALASPRNQRLGDMAAGTIVVRDRQLAVDLPTTAATRSDDPLVRDLGPAERDLVWRYAARRSSLAEAPRRALAYEIAEVIRPRLAASFDHLDDDSLLVHVAESALK